MTYVETRLLVFRLVGRELRTAVVPSSQLGDYLAAGYICPLRDPGDPPRKRQPTPTLRLETPIDDDYAGYAD